jgi:hypothetical protein
MILFASLFFISVSVDIFVWLLLGWIRLQNGYYLPISSDDGKIAFLHKVSAETPARNKQSETLGSETPKFVHQRGDSLSSELKQALDKLVLERSVASVDDKAQVFNVRPAIHMDAM